MVDKPNQTGLEAIFETKAFQAGLKIYNEGLALAEAGAKKAASAISSAFSGLGEKVGGTLSSLKQSLGNIIGGLGNTLGLGGLFGIAGGIGSIIGLDAAVSTLTKYHESINQVNSAMHEGIQVAADYVFGAKSIGLGIGTMTSAFQSFTDTIRQANYAQEDLIHNAAITFRDNSRALMLNARDLAEGLANLDREIARSAEDRARTLQRANDDYALSVYRTNRDNLESLRGVHGRERRLMIMHQKEAREDQEKARAREAEDRAIADKRRIEDNARTEMLLRRSSAESLMLLKQGMAEVARSLRVSAERNPLLVFLEKSGLSMKYLSDISVPLSDRIKLVGDALNKMPEGAEKSNAIFALFGTRDQKFLDFLEAGPTQIDSITKQLKGLGIVFDKKMIDEYTRTMAGLGIQFDILGIVIAKNVIPVIVPLVKMFTQFIANNMPLIKNFIDGVGDFTKKIAEGFKSNGLQGAFDAMQLWITGHKADIERTMKTLGDALGEGLRIVIENAKWVGARTSELVAKIKTWSETPEGKAQIKTSMDSIGNTLSWALDEFIKGTKWIDTIMGDLVKAIRKWATEGEGKKQLNDTGKAIQDSILQGLGFTDSKGNIDWNKILFGSAHFDPSLIGGGLFDWKNFFKSKGNEVDSTIVGMLINGIKNGFKDVDFSQAADDLLNNLKKAFGIQSPSKLSRDQVGMPLSQGIITGISAWIEQDEGKKQISDMIQELLAALLDRIGSLMGTFQWGAEILSGIAKSFVSELDSWTASMASYFEYSLFTAIAKLDWQSLGVYIMQGIGAGMMSQLSLLQGIVGAISQPGGGYALGGSVQMLAPATVGVSGGNTYQFNHNWTGAPANLDRATIEQVVQDATYAAMRKVIPGV